MSEQARPRTLDDSKIPALESWLAAALGASSLRLEEKELLPGGAVQENWRVSVMVAGGPRSGRHTWVLRTDAAAQMGISLSRAQEYAVIAEAHAAGIKVAEPIARCEDTSVIGRPYMLQGFVSGTAQARRIVRDKALVTYGAQLAEEIGAEMARIHAIKPSNGTLSFLPIPVGSPARIGVASLRGDLDSSPEARPVLEYALAWLDANRPEANEVALVHGDLRSGNYMVDDGRLAGVLDWEFAHWGDPYEDLGWFCARCWRFGSDHLEAGGIAERAALYRGYERVTGRKVDDRSVRYWEIYAAVRWGVIAVMQGDRLRTGGERSIELVLTGLMAPEMEYDALQEIEAYEQREG